MTTQMPAPTPIKSQPTQPTQPIYQRLASHYGNRADCRFGPIAGGYRVSMALPIDSDD